MTAETEEGFRSALQNCYLVIKRTLSGSIYASIGIYFENHTDTDKLSSDQGSRGRRIRRPGTKRFGLGRMVLLRDDSTDARFFRHEASQKLIYILHWFCLLATVCLMTSQDNCFQSLVYIFPPPKLNYVTGIMTRISVDRGNEACSHFDKQINLTI